MDGWMDTWMDGYMYGWMDGWMDTCMDGWMWGGGAILPTSGSMGFVFSITPVTKELSLSLSYPTLPAPVLLAQSRSERWGIQKFPSRLEKRKRGGPTSPAGERSGRGVGSSYSMGS